MTAAPATGLIVYFRINYFLSPLVNVLCFVAAVDNKFRIPKKGIFGFISNILIGRINLDLNSLEYVFK